MSELLTTPDAMLERAAAALKIIDDNIGYVADAKEYAERAEAAAELAVETVDGKADKIDVEANSNRIDNIAKLLEGTLFDYSTDTDTKYVKTVPSGALPYAGIESVGGRTLVWNQLVGENNATNTSDGITTTIDSNTGIITITNDSRTTNYSSGSTQIKIAGALTNGHKFVFLRNANKDTTGIGLMVLNELIQVTNVFNSSVFTISNANTHVSLRITNEYDFTSAHPVGDVMNCHIMLIDLTLLYGAGNEPSTVAEFQQTFPAVWYAYNKGQLMSAGVTEVVSKDSNNTTLQTYSIPAEIQALSGYGWSAGSVYNYIDFERKVFVKNVGRIDLGSLDWKKEDATIPRFTSRTAVADAKSPASTVIPNMVSPMYLTGVFNDVYGNSAKDKMESIVYPTSTDARKFIITDTNASYTDGNAFKSAMNGVYAYYELETPIETDISAYLTDDNMISVESGGTLTFPDSNGSDYLIPVPSEEVYMVDLQEAI